MIHGQRQVPRARHRVLDDGGDLLVHDAAPRPEIVVEDRREQGMGEADHAAVTLNHVRRLGRPEHVGLDAESLQERRRRRTKGGSERESGAGGFGEPGESSAHELVQRLRDGQRLERTNVPVEIAGQLERIERVAGRLIVNPEQGLVCVRLAATLVQQPVESPEAERSDRDLSDAFQGERTLQVRRFDRIHDPTGKQGQDRGAVKPAERKRQGTGRRTVQPLDVVDRDENGRPRRQMIEHVAHGHGKRAVVHDVAGRLLSQQRDLERAPSRRRERREKVVRDILKQVTQAGMCKNTLGLGGPRRDNSVASIPSCPDGRQPQRRLSDSGLALEHDCGRPIGRTVEERPDPTELLLATKDIARHRRSGYSRPAAVAMGPTALVEPMDLRTRAGNQGRESRRSGREGVGRGARYPADGIAGTASAALAFGGRVTRTDPFVTSPKPAIIAGVSVSFSTSMPRTAATAGLM